MLRVVSRKTSSKYVVPTIRTITSNNRNSSCMNLVTSALSNNSKKWKHNNIHCLSSSISLYGNNHNIIIREFCSTTSNNNTDHPRFTSSLASTQLLADVANHSDDDEENDDCDENDNNINIDLTPRDNNNSSTVKEEENQNTTASKAKLTKYNNNIHRLMHIRNVGVMAHVDAGKTTVTERMLALAGVVRQAGNVDDGNTVTDYLPAERERGITIQCAAISFPWPWHNNKILRNNNTDNNNNNTNNNKNDVDNTNTNNIVDDDDFKQNDNVTISLIDTPGHVDFSVEVNRSVAVLDGGVLVIDAVAGVQAQTETVWKAMTKPSIINNHLSSYDDTQQQQRQQHYHHEPLPCLVVINKMDKDGNDFNNAIQSVQRKLPGANPIPIQIPLFKKGISSNNNRSNSNRILDNIMTLPLLLDEESNNAANVNNNDNHNSGEFVGVVDLIHMRAVVWPDGNNNNSNLPEHCAPAIIPLIIPPSESEDDSNDHSSTQPRRPLDKNYCSITQHAIDARWKLVETLAAECGDTVMEEYYLQEVHPSNIVLRESIRQATLNHKGIPVLASAALRGKGIEPILDAIADFLPSPLDRQSPQLTNFDKNNKNNKTTKNSNNKPADAPSKNNQNNHSNNKSDIVHDDVVPLGHSMHPSLLAFAFKVVHMKGRGGGDGRVVFARVYSGTLRERDVVRVISPPALGNLNDDEEVEMPIVRKERIGGMLELAGGRFSPINNGECKSGSVCALVGLKSVVTGDTIVMYPVAKQEQQQNKKNKNNKNGDNKNKNDGLVCLSGVASPRPVLKVRLEAESTQQQARLSEALTLLAIEDPSLVVEETESSTLLSGLGELHIEITLDRLQREFGLNVRVGAPSVAYRETITEPLETDGLHNFSRLIGGTKLQASIQLKLEPTWMSGRNVDNGTACMMPAEPTVLVGKDVKEFLGFETDGSSSDDEDEELMVKSELFRGLVKGCKGAMKRGPVGSYPLSNVLCRVVAIDCEAGLAGLQALPGALRAAAADAITTILSKNKSTACTVLEPKMSLEITLPNDMVGTVLSDLTGRRGTIGEVLVGEIRTASSSQHTTAKALIRGEVPLVEILGYANTLRSITAGEGSFTAEYEGHSPY